MHCVPCETDHHSAAAICMLRMPLNTNHPLINSRDWLTNRLPYNLYCVGGDVKHCSLTHDWQILLTDLLVWHVYWAIWKLYSLCCLTRRTSHSDVQVIRACSATSPVVYSTETVGKITDTAFNIGFWWTIKYVHNHNTFLTQNVIHIRRSVVLLFTSDHWTFLV